MPLEEMKSSLSANIEMLSQNLLAGGLISDEHS